MINRNLERVINLDQRAFNENYFRPARPVIIEQGAVNSKAHQLWSLSYLKEKLQGCQIVVHHNKNGFYDHIQSVRPNLVERLSMPFEQAVDKIETEPEGTWYLQQASIDHELPPLKDDLEKLPWCEKFTKTHARNFWLGSENCVTPLHFDHFPNFLIQIRGRKALTLFSPSDSKLLYPNPASPSVSQVDIEAPDYLAHPLLHNATAFHLELSPGDVLYMPSGWWHQTRSLETNISVNIWWAPFFSWINLTHPFKVLYVLLFGRRASKVKRSVPPSNS